MNKATRTQVLLSILLFLLGVAGVGLSSNPTTKPEWRNVILGIGGLFLGASLTFFLNLLTETPQEKLRQALSETVKASFNHPLNTSEAHLSHLRAAYHHYHETIIGNERCWRHALYDFAASSAILIDPPGYIFAKYTTFEPRQGTIRSYTVRGFVKGPRLILADEIDQGAEDSMIEVFPFGGKGHQETLVGVLLLEGWDGQTVLGRVIMSRKPLHLLEPSNATIQNDQDRSRLEQKWTDQWNYHRVDATIQWPAPYAAPLVKGSVPAQSIPVPAPSEASPKLLQ